MNTVTRALVAALALVLAALAAAVPAHPGTYADVYLHNPRGASDPPRNA